MQKKLSKIELERSFNPKEFEEQIYKLWQSENAFLPKDRGAEDTFTIVMPPPNVTGILHIGHALDNILQDIIVRYKRMCGYKTLWVPGEDHAGIATQNVVEKKLRKEGVEPKNLKRDDFISETYAFAMEHKKIIQKQLRQMGVSVDWQRERFTMDAGSSHAVVEAFCSLYEEGNIYKGEYLVNWCPSCGTALSDEEVKYQDENAFLYHILYPLLDDRDNVVSHIEIATTRPETMLGDVAIACNPDDERYKELVGKFVLLPIMNKKIPIISDSYVEKDFGTGLVKITPAHDKNDWEVGKRHKLDAINILEKDGRLANNVAEKYRGLKVEKARTLILKDLEEAGLLKDKKKLRHAVGKCYRCGSIVEPYLSTQWFVKMDSLAASALKALEDGHIVFHPKKWENTYIHWLKNIRDWCISRQLVWGHRIPFWSCKECGAKMASREPLKECKKCNSKNIEQESDVLDTWFSSGLWPLSTLGFPNGYSASSPCTACDYKTFFPTNALVTGYDIIFFWVSRMIMFSLHFAKKVPFRDIYLHGLVRDKKGQKMSKSLGNGIDPLLVIDQYGADAMKFTLSFMCATGQDILIDTDSFRMGSRFANKIWNATRYIFSNLEDRTIIAVPQKKLTDMEKWILHTLNETALNIKTALEDYRYSEASQAVYEFFWNNYCDWYVEGLKMSFKEDDSEKDRATSVYLSILEESLRLLHPFLSFITEELYQHLPLECVQSFEGEGAVSERGKLLATSSYPAYNKKRCDDASFAKFSIMQEIVRHIRSLRLDLGIDPASKVNVHLLLQELPFPTKLEERDLSLLTLLSRSLSIIMLQKEEAKPKNSIGAVGSGFQIFISIEQGFDVDALDKSFAKKLADMLQEETSINTKLANKNFIDRAPKEVVEKEMSRIEELKEKISILRSYIKDLKDIS